VGAQLVLPVCIVDTGSPFGIVLHGDHETDLTSVEIVSVEIEGVRRPIRRTLGTQDVATGTDRKEASGVLGLPYIQQCRFTIDGNEAVTFGDRT